MNELFADAGDFLFTLISVIWSCAVVLAGTVITIFVGAFVALRAFYIQKRHERMADKYEQLFDALQEDMIGLQELVPEATEKQALEKLKKSADRLRWLSDAANLYLSAEAKALLDEYFDKSRDVSLEHASLNPMTPDGRNYNIATLCDRLHAVSEESLKALVNQARHDLRPGISRFWKEFWAGFLNG